MLKLIKYALIALFLASGVVSAQALRFPKNVRYIGAGYENKAPYFSTLNAALNNVKAFATPANPYIFWLASDSIYVSDWDSVYNNAVTMSDSINIYYVNEGSIKWGGLYTNLPSTIPTQTETTLHYDLPKWDPLVAEGWMDKLNTALDTVDQQIYSLIVYASRFLYIENDTLKIDTLTLASSLGITTNTVSGGIDSIYSTDTVRTITVSGGATNDIYVVTPLATDTTHATEELSVYAVSGGFRIKRALPAVASVARFAWIRKAAAVPTLYEP